MINSMLNDKKKQDKRMTLTHAIKTYVPDGSMITFSGMGGAQCVAPTYEIIRQGICFFNKETLTAFISENFSCKRFFSMS